MHKKEAAHVPFTEKVHPDHGGCSRRRLAGRHPRTARGRAVHAQGCRADDLDHFRPGLVCEGRQGDAGAAGHESSELELPGSDPRNDGFRFPPRVEHLPARHDLVLGLAPDVPLLVRADHPEDVGRPELRAPLLELRSEHGALSARAVPRHHQLALHIASRQRLERRYVVPLRVRRRDQRLHADHPVLHRAEQLRVDAARCGACLHRRLDGIRPHRGAGSDLLSPSLEHRSLVEPLAETGRRPQLADRRRDVEGEESSSSSTRPAHRNS